MITHPELVPTAIAAVIFYALFVLVVGSLVTWNERRRIKAERKKQMWDVLKR